MTNGGFLTVSRQPLTFCLHIHFSSISSWRRHELLKHFWPVTLTHFCQPIGKSNWPKKRNLVSSFFSIWNIWHKHKCFMSCICCRCLDDRLKMVSMVIIRLLELGLIASFSISQVGVSGRMPSFPFCLSKV